MARNTALSEYGQRVATEREELVAGLVQCLSPSAQASEEQHGALVEACLAALQHHKFADTNPRVVAEQYEGLGERFGEHAQFDKQRALQLLQGHMLGLPLKSSQYEFQHRLLSFLYATSRRPLAAPYAGGELVAALEAAARTSVVGPPTYLTDDGSSDGAWREEMGAYSPGSQLSDWSQLGTEEGEHGQPGDSDEAAAGDGMAAAAEAEDGTEAATQASTAAVVAWVVPRPPPQQRRQPPYTRASLSVWLASRRSGGQPARLLEPRLCFHERELVQQVVHLFKGVACPGPAFQLDASRSAYSPTPGVHLHTTSHGSLRAQLQRFARVATSLRRVQAFCSAAQAAAGTPPAAGSCSGSLLDRAASAEQRLYSQPTVAAFAAAVAEQQQAVQQQVLVLEMALAAGAALTLLQLQHRAAGLGEQAAALEGLVRRCRRQGDAAETAAGLLSGLHEALQLALLQARSQGGVLAAMLLRIFVATCRPLLVTLHSWLYRGVLHDPWHEFYVQASDTDIPTDSPRFWSDAYTLRLTGSGADGVPAAPSFLQPLAGGILAAGKAALLLHAHSSWRLAAAAARSGGAPPLPAAAACQPESPSKKRLSEYGALGFSIAAGQQDARRQPAWQPSSVPAAVAGSPAAMGDGSAEELGQEPPQLHDQLLANMERQLQEQLQLATSLADSPPPTVVQSQHAWPGDRASSSTSTQRSGSHACLDEWRAGSTACSDHTLLLPTSDVLPPLEVLPASPEGLPAAAVAVIPPAAGLEGSPCGFVGTHTAGSGGALTIAQRMQAAATHRVQQTTCALAEQLPLLLISPAPLDAPAVAADGSAGAEFAAAALTTTAEGAATTDAGQFDSSNWQRYYQRVSAALACQLDVLDCLGGGDSISSGRRQLASSHGVPLGLPLYSGRPSEQLCGRAGSLAAHASDPYQLRPRHQPLRPELAAATPPLEVLLQRCLLQPMAVRVAATEGALCAALLRRGLLHQLAALRDTYLLGSPLLEPFVAFLLRRISTMAGGMDQLPESDLNASLQDALEAGGQARRLRATAHILADDPGGGGRQPSGGGGVPRVQQLARLALRVEPGWPLCLVAGEEMLGQYNALRWVKQSLQAVRYAGWKAGRRAAQGPAARDGLQHQMMHLVDAVMQYISDRAVAECTSLDQMHACRAKYQRAVTRYCLLSSEGVARLVQHGLLHLLNACLLYCSLRKRASAADAALAALAETSAAEALLAAGGSQRVQQDPGEDSVEGEEVLRGQPSVAGLAKWAGRGAELQRRRADVAEQLTQLRREFANRQRLLLRVLSTKAAEAGSHADELSQLLAALDFSGYFERGMT